MGLVVELEARLEMISHRGLPCFRDALLLLVLRLFNLEGPSWTRRPTLLIDHYTINMLWFSLCVPL
jgi:hypothetical protein